MSTSHGYGGAVILTNRGKSFPILEATALTVREVDLDNRLCMFFRERDRERMSLNLHTAEGVSALDTIRSLDYFCVGASDSFCNPLDVPSLNRTIREVVSGTPDLSYFDNRLDGERNNALCKLLSSLSHLPEEGAVSTEADTNFMTMLKHRLFDRIGGQYSAGLFLHSIKSNIILANRGTDDDVPQVSLLVTKDCVALTWFSKAELQTKFMDRLRADEEEKRSMMPLLIPVCEVRDSLLVIHPVHVVSKWVKSAQRATNKNPCNPYVTLNIVARHVTNNLLPLQR